MAQKTSPLGLIVFIGSLVFLVFAILIARRPLPRSIDPALQPLPTAATLPAPRPLPSPTPRPRPQPSAPSETGMVRETTKSSSKIWADISQFVIARKIEQYSFRLQFFNETSQDITAYAIVYGKNDAFTPPRRGAWPKDDELFRLAGTDKGELFAKDISANWSVRPDTAKGKKFTIPANGMKQGKGALPFSAVCRHEAWRGQPIDPKCVYQKISLWLFSEDGKLLFEKKYNLQ